MTVAEGDSPSQETRLRLLLVEYQTIRDDTRADTAALNGVAAVSIALMVGVVAVLAGKVSVPSEVFALLPLPATVLLLFAAVLDRNATVSGFYARMIERELAQASGVSAAMCGQAVQLPLLLHILNSTDTKRQEGGTPALRMTNFLILLLVGTTFIGGTVWSLVRTGPFWVAIIAGLVLYFGPLCLAATIFVQDLAYGPQMWRRSVNAGSAFHAKEQQRLAK